MSSLVIPMALPATGFTALGLVPKAQQVLRVLLDPRVQQVRQVQKAIALPDLRVQLVPPVLKVQPEPLVRKVLRVFKVQLVRLARRVLLVLVAAQDLKVRQALLVQQE